MPGKILFITQSAGFIGGLEKYIHSVSGLLRQNGFQTALLYVEKVKYSDAFLTGFDEIFDMSEISKMNAEDFALSTLHKISDPGALEAILSKFSPAAFVHDHDYFCPKGYKYYPCGRINCTRAYSRIFCGLCASIVPPRHINEGVSTLLSKNFFKSAKLNALVKTCPRFVVLSEFMRKCLINNGVGKESIFLLHPFLEETETVIKSKNETPKIVFAGQQVMSKGVTLLLESIKGLKNKTHTHILGAGLRLEHFKEVSKSMGISDRVTFEGWVKNPSDFFKSADIAVFPSMWQEPFGLSGIEAMRYGVPVVGFDVGGVSEWLKNGVNGILVRERDTSSMAQAIDTLICGSRLRANMGENARNFVKENYSPEKFLTDFKKLL